MWDVRFCYYQQFILKKLDLILVTFLLYIPSHKCTAFFHPSLYLSLPPSYHHPSLTLLPSLPPPPTPHTLSHPFPPTHTHTHNRRLRRARSHQILRYSTRTWRHSENPRPCKWRERSWRGFRVVGGGGSGGCGWRVTADTPIPRIRYDIHIRLNVWIWKLSRRRVSELKQ